MEKNVGGFDRVSRLVVGALLVLVGLTALAGVLGIGTLSAVVAIVVGAVLIGTGVVQKCLLSRLLGVDTYRSEVDAESESEPMDEVSTKRAG